MSTVVSIRSVFRFNFPYTVTQNCAPVAMREPTMDNSPTTTEESTLPDTKSKVKEESVSSPKTKQENLDEKMKSGVIVEPSIEFNHTYYRNDRRNLQCFPICGKYAEYKQHHEVVVNSRSAKTYCKLPFEVSVSNLPPNCSPSSLQVFGRVCEVTCLPTEGLMEADVDKYFKSQSNEAAINVTYRPKTAMLFAEGDVIDLETPKMSTYMESEFNHEASPVATSQATGPYKFKFHMGNWKYSAKLPKTRLEVLTTKFMCQFVVLQKLETGEAGTRKFKVLSIYDSSTFKISNTRSLGGPKRDIEETSVSESEADSRTSAKKQRFDSSPMVQAPVAIQYTNPAFISYPGNPYMQGMQTQYMPHGASHYGYPNSQYLSQHGFAQQQPMMVQHNMMQQFASQQQQQHNLQMQSMPMQQQTYYPSAQQQPQGYMIMQQTATIPTPAPSSHQSGGHVNINTCIMQPQTQSTLQPAVAGAPYSNQPIMVPATNQVTAGQVPPQSQQSHSQNSLTQQYPSVQ